MSDQSITTIGSRLKLFRESKNWTQAQLAKMLGGAPGGLQKNELDLTLPNSKMLIGLHALDLNVNWLLTGEGSMLRSSPAQGMSSPVEDIKAYGDCVEILELALGKLGRTLTPEKKRVALDSMYRAWSRERKMDQRLVEMIVQLAA